MHERVPQTPLPETASPKIEAINSFASYLDEKGIGGEKITDREEKNALIAFSLQAKPGVFLTPKASISQSEEVALKSNLEPLGVNAIGHKNILLNPDLISERLRQEKDFAQEIGWNTDKTVVENIKAATGTERFITEPQLAARLGFVLGYPASAIRTYARQTELNNRGLKLPVMLIRELKAQPNWDPTDAKAFSSLQAEEKAIRSRYDALLRQPNADTHTIWGNKLAEQKAMARKYEPTVRRIYTNYLGATQNEVDFLMSVKAHQIESPVGVAYSFIVEGEKGAEQPDVMALEKKVVEAFKGINLEQ